MACKTQKSRKLACKDQRGGIKNKVIFANWAEYGFVVVNQKIADLPVSLTEVFAWEVKGTPNKLDENITVSEDNGTKEVAQTLNLVFPKLDADTEVELDAMAAGRTIAFVPDYNGNWKVVGIDSGLTTATANASTGGAGTDLSGYTLNLAAKDSKYAPFLDPSLVDALLALVVEDGIIDI